MFCNRLVFVALAGALIFLVSGRRKFCFSIKVLFNGVSFELLLWNLFMLQEPVNTDIRRDCRRETKVSWAALKKMKSGDFEQNDQKLKCYVKCFMVKNGILNNNAEIDVQRALRHIPRSLQDSSRHLFNKCKSVTYKPLLERPPTPAYYPPQAPMNASPYPAYGQGPAYAGGLIGPGASDNGCCSWTRDCCGGGCCSRAGCCSTEPPVLEQPTQRPPVGHRYEDLYGCGQPRTMGPPMGMAGGSTYCETEERVPCTGARKDTEIKLPKCYGGDCEESQECENDVTESTPQQSEQ
ncbi:hypothetical protein WN55_03993 [Dufourea novaeangliae]|uniref:Uncharacterized protein n=1 Tax=Dufourea novaeangliae TaxID=178035 RepID=A0A154PKS9_DUFNO|nr:hypothetical protein WN55_03993 [Dufourea novaeangliae]